LARQTHQRILDLDEQLEAIGREVVSGPMPKGVGAATSTLLAVEMVDWSRFKNRKQVGSYLGCSPREHSTGEGQLLGRIDKIGNKRARSALTEAVWRLLRWEPGWRGFATWGAVLREKNIGGVRKKKAVIACVRLLGIDLWRLATQRATLAQLGFVQGAQNPPVAAPPEAAQRPAA
jgi:transposase